MDPFSDIVTLLRPRAAISKPISGRGDWAVRYAAHDRPGYAVVLAGRCWLAVEGAPPVSLERGDFVLLPTTPAFSLSSRPGIAPVDVLPTTDGVRHGDPDGEPDFEALGGSFRIDPVNAPLLLSLLPEMIRVRSRDDETGCLARVVGLIVEECAGDRPGREAILERLLEVTLVECLRRVGVDRAEMSTGLLAGLADPSLARVLRALHADVGAAWTVGDLAKLAGLSRSGFAARFSDTLGCGPMEYLGRWRMTLARDALSRGGKSLERLASEIGYESASAFSTAFRRRVGCSPGAFAKSHRHAEAVH